VAGLTVTARDRNQRIADVFHREQSRLRHFIRRRVPDPRDAEDVLQDVFYKLVEANQLLMPIEHVTGWLFRVARNRITDLLRKKQPVSFGDLGAGEEEVEVLFQDLLASPDAGPDVLYARQVLGEELEAAIAELPPEQRAVFVAHELEGRGYQELAAATGVNVNTLLSRKRYAVLRLRERLREIYEDWL
jgi:RNA polymerase sigma factor (sigma-70 family)